MTTVALNWGASTDSESNIGGYKVFRNGTFVLNIGTTNFNDSGLLPGVTYTYAIAAFDSSPQLNQSAQSLPANATTDAEVFVNVPSVVDQAQAIAEATITTAGLQVGTITTSNSSTVAAGSVISQNPTGGTSVLEGSPVDLLVSLGEAPVVVPGVVGQNVVTATTTLNNGGLVVGTVTRVYSNTVALDAVISQNPVSGLLVANGSAVSLVVSDGPAPPDTTPPSVPTGLVATVAGAYQINLSWAPSVDTESSVAGYYVFRNGILVGSPAATNFAATGLDPITNYAFTVSAFDASPAANGSLPSSPVNATTDAEPVWENQDIGAVATAGSLAESNGTLTVQASGADVWGSQDEFHFVYQTLSGDGEIVARVASLVGTNGWAKAGVMMRESLTNNSAHAMVVTTVANGTDTQYRGSTAGPTTSVGGGDGVNAAPYWVRLVREGDTFTAYKSADGANWVQDDQATITMSSVLYVGLMATSHNDGVLATAVFDNVTVTPAVPPLP